MKKITLFFAFIFSFAFLQAQDVNLQEILSRYEGLKNVPQSEDMVLKQNFTTLEIEALRTYFSQNNLTSNAQVNGVRVPDTFTVLNVRGGDVFGTIPGTGPYTTITQIANPLGARSFCGDYDQNGVLYGYNIMLDATNTFVGLEFISIDDATGTVTTIGDVFAFYSTFPSGISYDFTTNTMYGLVGGELVTIDLTTGAPTSVGFLGTGGNVPIWLVIDNAGQGYAADIGDDAFYTVNLATGQADLVGDLGINISFAQDATIDPEDNTLYMGAYIGAGVGGVYSVDVTTGEATLVGDTTPLNAEFGIFAVKGVPVLGINENIANLVSVYPNPTTDILNVKVPANITVNSASLVSVLGANTGLRLVNGTINTSSLASGVYILTVNTSAGTMTQKVVKQ